MWFVKQIGPSKKSGGILQNIILDRGEPLIGVGRWRGDMHLGDRGRQLVRQCCIELTAVRDMIQCLALIETDHLDGPFYGRSSAVQHKAAIRLTRD